MNRHLKHYLLLSALLAPALAMAADTSVSVRIGQPGFYGRIDIGGAPPPVLVTPRAIVIDVIPPGVHRAPVYLRVKPGHEKDWRKHCRHYSACGQPVYFVRDDWYEEVYVPHHHERHGKRDHDDHGHDHPGKGHGKGHHKGHGKGH